MKYHIICFISQSNNLSMVHRGVKFSCRFTLKEISQRWYALLYDSTISRLAVSAMRNLHPETVANIEAKALFSVAEEDILATIQSVCHNFILLVLSVNSFFFFTEFTTYH